MDNNRSGDNHLQGDKAVTSAIDVSGLNKWFDQFHVLKDVSLSVSEKEIIVVCGPSGSGKSTFIRCINHLEKYQQGSISIFGKKLGKDKKSAALIRDNVGMLFQNFNLFNASFIQSNLLCYCYIIGFHGLCG